MAKAAVAHYTRYLAQDLAPYGINALAIAPGYIGSGQFKKRLLALKQFGALQNVANLV